MFCLNCGKENPDGAQFCKGCGSPMAAQAPAPVPVMAQPAAPVGYAAAPAAYGQPQQAAARLGGVKGFVSNNKRSLIILIAAMVLVAVVAIVLVNCMGGSAAPAKGSYSVRSGDSDSVTLTVSEDGMVTALQDSSDSSHMATFKLVENGSLDGSGIFDAIDFQGWDGSRIITGTGDYILSDGTMSDTKIPSLQFIIPKGGTTGHPEGLWGMSVQESYNGSLRTGMVLFDVRSDGQGVMYEASYDSLVYSEMPSIDELSAIGAINNSRTFTWIEGGANSYLLTLGDTVYTIQMPVN